jgi:hypothetical protein
MGRWRNVNGGGHEGEEKHQKSKESSAAAHGIERRGVVNGWDAEELHDKNQDAPEVPTIPEAKEPKQEKNNGHED